MRVWNLMERRKRRNDTRRVEFCPVMFKHGGHAYSAFLVDLSPGGAKLRAHDGEKGPQAQEGAEVVLDIKTPYGASSCKARVLWREEHEDGYRWGVEFTELPSDKGDPINCLIESALC
jgi:c-di-GMP-binding flagellar brake protein YcgR